MEKESRFRFRRDGIMGLLNLENGRESTPTLKWPPIFEFRCDVLLFDDEHIIYLTRFFFSQWFLTWCLREDDGKMCDVLFLLNKDIWLKSMITTGIPVPWRVIDPGQQILEF